MTISPWLVYLWGIADSVRDGAILISMFAGIFAIVGAIAVPTMESDGDVDRGFLASMRKLRLVITTMFFVALPVAFLTPSSRTVAIMVIAPAIVNSSVIQKDVPELYEAAKKAMLDNLTGKN